MTKLKLPGVGLNDILLRLEDEPGVCALAGSTDGWETVAAWRPADSYQFKGADAKDSLPELEKFAATQQQKGRLLIGYLSYDFGCALHGVPLASDDDLSLPDVMVFSFDNWLAFDKGGVTVEGSDAAFRTKVQQILKRQVRPIPAKTYRQKLSPVISRQQYHQAYQKVQKYILGGDVYQINLTHRLEGSTDNDSLDLFCLLSGGSQAGFQAYIEGDGFEVLSQSPERFIRVQDRAITTSPIKGTRPRGMTDAKDKALREELLTSPKDKAELNMITDLMRNDLGAICEVGSVRVVEARKLTAYPTLWHAQSTIAGQLRNDITPISALASVLPGGSITGCPKKRAIEVIDELEPRRRGIYTGSIFTISPDGRLDSNIAIRTMVKKSDRLYLSVGGGIVYDSTESDEYQESLDKAAAFLGNSSLGRDM